MDGKPPRVSAVEKTELVLPSDANNLGSVFGGRVMSWIDIAAAITAQRHCRRTVVTASMDDLHFHNPIRRGHIAILRSRVVFTGNTSLEVMVEVDSEDPLSGEQRRCCEAWMTFVALGEDGRPTSVPPVVPETPEDQALFEEGQERRRYRMERKRKREGT